MAGEVKKTTVRLPEDALSQLEQLAKEQNITLTGALQKAIATEYYRSFITLGRRK